MRDHGYFCIKIPRKPNADNEILEKAYRASPTMLEPKFVQFGCWLLISLQWMLLTYLLCLRRLSLATLASKFVREPNCI